MDVAFGSEKWPRMWKCLNQAFYRKAGDSWCCNKISGPTEDYGKMDFCIDDHKHFPVAFTTSVTCYGSYFI